MRLGENSPAVDEHDLRLALVTTPPRPKNGSPTRRAFKSRIDCYSGFFSPQWLKRAAQRKVARLLEP
jgi:hypothetical protein